MAGILYSTGERALPTNSSLGTHDLFLSSNSIIWSDTRKFVCRKRSIASERSIRPRSAASRRTPNKPITDKPRRLASLRPRSSSMMMAAAFSACARQIACLSPMPSSWSDASGCTCARRTSNQSGGPAIHSRTDSGVLGLCSSSKTPSGMTTRPQFWQHVNAFDQN